MATPPRIRYPDKMTSKAQDRMLSEITFVFTILPYANCGVRCQWQRDTAEEATAGTVLFQDTVSAKIFTECGQDSRGTIQYKVI